MTKAKVGALRPGQKAALWVLPLLFAFAALCIGRIRLPPAEVLRSILAKLGLGAAAAGQTEQILWTMRFPRVLLALLVGAGLSVAGCAFQSLFSNPLATPDTLGVASGASFGAALGILLGLGLTGIQLTALAFGVSAVALTYLSGMDRFSTVAIRENNVLDGDMEELIIDGVTDILQKLPAMPRAVLIYTSCIHHFMACDLPRVYGVLRARFPGVAFADCYMIIDTPGFDDEGTLGELRVKKAKQVLNKTDVAVLVVDASVGYTGCDRELIGLFKAKAIHYIVAMNKSDLMSGHPAPAADELYISAETGDGVFDLKERIAHLVPTDDLTKRLVGDLIAPGQTAVLVVPIDSAAPKGRLILPQQQVIRDVLESDGLAMTTDGVDEAKADEIIRTVDRRRKTYHNYYSEHKWGDSRGYDVVMNTSRLGISGTADALIYYIKAFQAI